MQLNVLNCGHCVLLGDELFTDTFPVKLIDGLYYEVEGKVSWVFEETMVTCYL
jgi:hypothetical protein